MCWEFCKKIIPINGKIIVAEKAWSGVFSEATDRRVEKFTESVSFDRRLYAQDIAGSIAHAQMLAKVGLITADECQKIRQALEQIRTEIEQDKFPFRSELEDVHMHIERALIDRLGDVGRKLHTARSRNDQVSTDLRLWVREAIGQIDRRLI
jgi:argininosuccinate lyase